MKVLCFSWAFLGTSRIGLQVEGSVILLFSYVFLEKRFKATLRLYEGFFAFWGSPFWRPETPHAPWSIFFNVFSKLPNHWFSYGNRVAERALFENFLGFLQRATFSVVDLKPRRNFVATSRMYCNLQCMRTCRSTKCCNLQYILVFEIRKSFLLSVSFHDASAIWRILKENWRWGIAFAFFCFGVCAVFLYESHVLGIVMKRDQWRKRFALFKITKVL